MVSPIVITLVNYTATKGLRSSFKPLRAPLPPDKAWLDSTVNTPIDAPSNQLQSVAMRCCFLHKHTLTYIV